MTAATGDSLEFGYDALKRLNRVTVKNGSSVILNTAYAYRDVSWNRGSAQVEFRNVRLGSDSGMLLEGKKYVYDDVGNLKEIRESTGKYNKLVEYAYDSQNQLTSEAYYKSGEAEAYITYNYTYDTAGNLLTVSQKKGNTTTLLQTYTYGDAQWHDLLTAVNTGSHKTTGTKDTAKRCVWSIAKMKFQNNIIAGKTVKHMCHHCCI